MEGPTLLTTIHTPPKIDDFTPLSEHQERTPATFFGGKPVLHHHAASARALVPASQRRSLPIFRTATAPTEDESADAPVEQTVDVFVNSATFTLFSQDAAVGVQIPYPLIGIHAIKTLSSDATPPTTAVYMQLDLQPGQEGDAADDEPETVELTIVPAPQQAGETQALFAAISACAELHPDPADDDSDGGYQVLSGGNDEDDDDRIIFESADGFEAGAGVLRGTADGGLPPAMPGSSGWITADNVHEYFDADGNWIADGTAGELGEGAGRVRGRDEAGQDAAPELAPNGQHNGDDPDTKRQRTD